MSSVPDDRPSPVERFSPHRQEVRMLPRAEEWRQALEGIARAVSIIVSAREGRLAAVTVAGPAALVGGDLEHQIRERLADVGLDFVDVRTVPTEGGPLRLVSTEFEPW